MFKLSGAVLFILIIGNLENTIVFASVLKWIPIGPGDYLPLNVVKNDVHWLLDSYVGRARHFEDILLAEVTGNSARIKYCNTFIYKEHFEVLTSTVPGKCQWLESTNLENGINQNIVRGLTAFNGEPTYIGKKYISSESSITMTAISLKNRTTNPQLEVSDGFKYLICESESKWFDTPSSEVPTNAVYGGKSSDGHDMYVALLKHGSNDYVMGQVIPSKGIAFAVLYDGQTIESSYCEVLIGNENQYKWVSAKNGTIPENPFVIGIQNLELSYLVRYNNTIGNLTHSEALESLLEYDVLVLNGD